ncbi:MAG: penicillin-binding protein activator LpoB [Proteobacteria bacterium]|nr:penicillin-binding protein activator LpoB [Pseudomonadota bacterium]MBU4295025.1 penicillin-binding protein activator LpoB [Pseudomonadota bacterium]MCG2746623.1 penicillin-binding protein activator LpoB [Desulfobulbaceae bacterium]
MKRIMCSILTLMCFSILTGCSGKTTVSFMREDVTLDFVNRISVLPLENNTEQKYAAELARDVINTEILAMNIFDVVDKGITDSVLHEEAIDPGSPVSQLMLSRLGQRLNVQSIMIGSVDMAGDKRIGSVIVPEMSLTLRLIEIKSGIVLWQASGHYAGDSVVGRLFGITPDDAYKVTVKLAKELLSTIPERQNVPVPVPAAPVADKPVVVRPVSVTTDVVEPAVSEESAPAEPVTVEGEPSPSEQGGDVVEPAVPEEPAPAEPAVDVEIETIEPAAVVVEPSPAEPVDVEVEPPAPVVEPAPGESMTVAP